LALEIATGFAVKSGAMSKINLEHLTPEQKRCLGRVYQFIIERGRRNRAMAEKKQMAAGPTVSEVDTGHYSVSKGQELA